MPLFDIFLSKEGDTLPIRSSEYFSYAGINSKDLGIINVNITQGLLEEPFLANREIIEESIPGRIKPYFKHLQYQPLEFTISGFFEEVLDETHLREIARWLHQDYYQPLWFSDNPERIFYAMYVDDSTLVHNGQQGYFTLKFRCDSPYSYSTVYTTEIITDSICEIRNLGDLNLYPEIWIYKTGDGDFSIKNLTNNEKTTIFTDLVNNETVYLNCESEDIVSDISGVYRYSNYNQVPLELILGKNDLEISGGSVQFRFQYIFLQG